MAYDSYLYFSGAGADGVKGATTDAQLNSKGAFEVYSFSWGASNPTSVGTDASGMSAGKVSISSLNIMKKADTASNGLLDACAKGTHIDTCVMELRKSAGDTKGQTKPFVVITMNEVMVESVQQSGSAGGDDTPTESLSLAFGKVKYEYFPQTKDGTIGTAKTFTYDITKRAT